MLNIIFRAIVLVTVIVVVRVSDATQTCGDLFSITNQLKQLHDISDEFERIGISWSYENDRFMEGVSFFSEVRIFSDARFSVSKIHYNSSHRSDSAAVAKLKRYLEHIKVISELQDSGILFSMVSSGSDSNIRTRMIGYSGANHIHRDFFASFFLKYPNTTILVVSDSKFWEQHGSGDGFIQVYVKNKAVEDPTDNSQIVIRDTVLTDAKDLKLLQSIFSLN